ncbi:hypothetical protein P7K49_037345 [Saguinus oedipus]|uniref:Uncharacterized protein n=1 Tax=Saguinus oedipus TaxID=9490 RepID=A0ABQ9THT8_SAGOE|nr:hypothetical protein P7K49_037345 [Saguinus oedipus]
MGVQECTSCTQMALAKQRPSNRLPTIPLFQNLINKAAPPSPTLILTEPSGWPFTTDFSFVDNQMKTSKTTLS